MAFRTGTLGRGSPHAGRDAHPAAASPTLLFLKREPGVVLTPTTGERAGSGERRVRVRCPRCGWEPRKDDRWMCLCLHVWNTFDTGGVCPACGHAWRDTQCLRCHRWSPHESWYVEEGGQGGEG